MYFESNMEKPVIQEVQENLLSKTFNWHTLLYGTLLAGLTVSLIKLVF